MPREHLRAARALEGGLAIFTGVRRCTSRTQLGHSTPAGNADEVPQVEPRRPAEDIASIEDNETPSNGQERLYNLASCP